MDTATVDELLDGYARWWRDSFETVQAGEGVRIITPMLDRHNDYMSIYLAPDPASPGGYILTDMGETVSDLEFDGIDILGSPSRSAQLEAISGGYGLDHASGELSTRTTRGGLFNAINFMMQGMSTVDDLFLTSRGAVRSMFKEDVAKWLDEKGIRYSPDIRIAGRSGFEAHFDFVIPKTGKRAPERLLKTVSSPSKQTVSNLLFGCEDIRSKRRESAIYVFLNKENARNGEVDNGLIEACLAYDVKPVIWDGGADDVYEALAA